MRGDGGKAIVVLNAVSCGDGFWDITMIVRAGTHELPMVAVQVIHHLAARFHGSMELLKHEDVRPTLLGGPWRADVRHEMVWHALRRAQNGSEKVR